MSQEEFASSFRGSPMKRAKLRGLRCNAAVVLGNVGSADDVPALAAALSDPEPLVRSHAAWALGRIGFSEAVESRRARAAEEPDVGVLAELLATPALTRRAASVGGVSALYTWERYRGARERRAPN